jgi:hypothetical protein
VILNFGHLEQIIYTWAMPRINLQHAVKDIRKFITVHLWNACILSFEHSSVKPLHVICPKGGMQRSYLVEDAAQRPDIALGVIRHVAPNLWRCIIRCPCLRHTKAMLRDLRDIEITELSMVAFLFGAQKYVGALEITM